MGSAKIERRLQGVGASSGIAIGPVALTDRSRVAVDETPISPGDIPKEVARFTAALLSARDELVQIKDQLAERQGSEHLYVLDTHLLILEDALLIKETISFIENRKINAEAALQKTLEKFRGFFAGIQDEYLRERSVDVEVVVERILRNMTGTTQQPVTDVSERSIIVSHDLSPADILQIDKSKVVGFVTDMGGKTSHSAILARALEIPAIVGVDIITREIHPGDVVIIDGSTGTIVINPAEASFREYLQLKQRQEYIELELEKLKDLPAETTDGYRVALKANAEFIEEVPSIIRHGGDGVGLYRTEMLFLNRLVLPTEEEQFQAYASLVQQMFPLPVTIRTLDLGGDKILTDISFADEANPALGVRAIRLSLHQPEIFKQQLRAILRASALGNARMFFPMISGVSEIRQAKALLLEAKEELRQASVPFDESICTGIMIEIPSAVIIADILAKEVDFFSVGTNDLIQYSLAIDRTNEHLSHLYQQFHPAILRSLKMVVDAAHDAGIDACICGEMAGDPLCLPVLLGLGFDELSMNAASIPKVKEILRRFSRREAEELVATALELSTAEEVENLLLSRTSRHSPA